MRDLILLLDQVELLGNAWVVLKLVLARLREDFDHVLDSHTDLALVQHRAEPIKHTVARLGRLFAKKSAHFAHERDGQLDTVVGGVFQQQHENFKCNKLVHNALIHEVCKEEQRGVALGLVVAAERTAKLRHESHNQQLANKRQFGVHNGC